MIRVTSSHEFPPARPESHARAGPTAGLPRSVPACLGHLALGSGHGTGPATGPCRAYSF